MTIMEMLDMLSIVNGEEEGVMVMRLVCVSDKYPHPV